MKLYVILAGLLTHFAPDVTLQKALEVLMLGDPMGAHKTFMQLVPAGYPLDSHEVWELDGDQVVINPNADSGEKAELQGTDLRWLHVKGLLGGPDPIVKPSCLGKDALTTCRIGAERLLRARIYLDGNYKLFPVEVDEDGKLLPPAGQPVFHSVLRDLVTGQESKRGPYAGAALAVAATTFSAGSPPVVVVNDFEIKLGPSSDPACKAVDPTHSGGGCYIVRLTNFTPHKPDPNARHNPVDRDHGLVDRDYGLIYELLTNPPTARLVPVAVNKPITSEPITGASNPPETRCSGGPLF